jgi:hypothetical protein
MENNTEDQVYIQDAFQYLVCGTGHCVAKFHSMAQYPSYAREPHWTVHQNGRLFVQIAVKGDAEYLFRCKTTSGTVEVRFPKKR